ncbi:MAG: arsenate reductase ArsC [Spirochaetales bacterium]|nr:arsenate reductase ArsC [Spirochaetales bacterium]MCF7939831.1 arsenate reductase ArsC [Spirochaetales bacterium]
MDSPIRVLFVCVHNSARSQMAEEYLRTIGGDLFEVKSAGLEPGKINPFVVRILKEDGIDISGKTTRKALDLYTAGEQFDHVITVCSKKAEEKCPIFPGAKSRRNWPFDDPSKFTGSDNEVMNGVRKIRDQVKAKVRDFIWEITGDST